MEAQQPTGQVMILNLSDPKQSDDSLRALKALASEPRLEILRLLGVGPYNVKEIADALGMPLSTATLHVKALEEAGVISTELSAASRGLQKMCARRYDAVLVRLPDPLTAGERRVQSSIPIGAYTDSQVQPPCGLASATGMIGWMDDPASFFEPGRIDAQLLWFMQGYVEYRIPHRLPHGARPLSLSLRLEIGSEAPLYAPDWPSDITFWVNGVEIATWTAPGDFGGRRGLLTPDWWDAQQSQYGLLKQITVTAEGTSIDGLLVSSANLAALRLEENRLLRLRIGVKRDAANPRGLNLFGRGFGNHPQDILFEMAYE